MCILWHAPTICPQLLFCIAFNVNVLYSTYFKVHLYDNLKENKPKKKRKENQTSLNKMCRTFCHHKISALLQCINSPGQAEPHIYRHHSFDLFLIESDFDTTKICQERKCS